MSNILNFEPNDGKNIEIETADYGKLLRYPVRTHVIMSDEKLNDIMDKYVVGNIEKDDYMFISEKVVAICQGRAFDIDDIKPRPLAKLLCKFVYK